MRYEKLQMGVIDGVAAHKSRPLYNSPSAIFKNQPSL
jgi:hypothetical protein